MDTKDTKKCLKMPEKMQCEVCDFECSKMSNYESHILTAKHKKRVERYKKIQENAEKCQKMSDKYTCNCSKQFKYHSGLWRHKKACLVITDEDGNTTISDYVPEEYSIDPSTLSDKDLIMLLINENKEFKQIVLDQHKTIIDLSKNSNTNQSHNNHSLNKTFNLQFFLNEQCKDALNLSDFVSSVTMELSDLEETGRLGYVEGVSRIINKNLNKLDVYKRPIHCSDLKRETLYIKNDDEWKKEGDGNSVIIKAIKDVANENIKQIGEWRKAHPGCSEANSNKNDFYLKIVSNAMSGSTREEQMTNYEKIVSKIAKEVVIVK